MPADRFDQKKRGPQAQQENAEKEVEEQGPQQEAPDQTQQNLLGNQAIASLMGADAKGEMDLGVELLGPVKRPESEGIQYGGEADPEDEGGLTLDDLLRNWNPSARHTEDRVRFIEPMPDDVLPEEETAFLGAVRVPYPLPPASGVLALGVLQPSREVISASLYPWARALSAWSGGTLLARTLEMSARTVPPAMQDPWGRTLIARARAVSLGVSMLAYASRVARPMSAATAGLASFHLELMGRAHTVRNKALEFSASEEKLPLATDLYERWYRGQRTKVNLAELHLHESELLRAALRELLRLTDPFSLVIPPPVLPTPVTDEDDPLGLDAVLRAFTEPAPDPEARAYQSAVQSAEKLAHAAAQTRVQAASVAVLLSHIGQTWSAGDASVTLISVLGILDKDVQSMFKTLVDVGGAAHARTVELAGIHMGLTRTARALQKAQNKLVELLVRVVAGIIPGTPEIFAHFPPSEDPLESAMNEGRPALASPWLKTQIQSDEDELAWLLVRATAAAPGTLVGEAGALYAKASSHIKPLAGLLWGGELIWSGQPRAAVDLGDRQFADALTKRNGVQAAEAVLLRLEGLRLMGDLDALEATRLRGGRALWTLGAHGGLSLLARWKPPENDA